MLRALLMLRGEVHACGPDPAGFDWDWDQTHRRPVAMVAPEHGQRMIDVSPHLFGWRPDPVPAPAPARRPRKEAP